MPELRQNPITKQWVIISTERAKRPEDLVKPAAESRLIPSYSAHCPFCPGNEYMTPPEVRRFGTDGRWQVRVVPNKFAALSSEGERIRRHEGLLRSTVSGVGHHQVIVETPDHSKTLALLSTGEVELVLRCYRECYLWATSDSRVEYVTLFKNHGLAAGSSLEHSHSQVIATPVIPPDIRTRLEESLRYFDWSGECIYCKVLLDELAEGVRLVQETEHFVAFIPFAALTPFSMWIFPRRHAASFSQIREEEIRDLAGMLRLVLAKLYYGLGNPDYNYVVRSAPSEARNLRYSHWYITVIPRLTRTAGFELGSGIYINPTIPEENAEFLRSLAVPEQVTPDLERVTSDK